MKALLPRLLATTMLLALSAAAFSQVVDPEPGHMTADGPYIFHMGGDSSRVVSVSTYDGNAVSIVDTVGVTPDSFTVVSHDGSVSFDVTLHPVSRQSCRLSRTGRTFITSDPHGRLDCLLSILKAGGVIGEDLHWCFGCDRLVIIGDVMDRGDDVTQIFWFLYRLEKEAEDAGGSLTFVYGNHEPMVLAGDLRYTRAKYLTLADTLGLSVPALYGADTELGRWLATRNTMTLVGDDLFVHAGISGIFCEEGLTMAQLNEMCSRGLFMTKEEKKADSKLMYSLFRTPGPVWYRGYFQNLKKYGGRMDGKTLDASLDQYGAKRVFVGHTIVRNIHTLYDGRVVAVDVDAKINYDKGRGRGILIDSQGEWVVRDSGRKTLLR